MTTRDPRREDSGSPASRDPDLDGRRARSQHSRERILDALAQALEEPDLGEVTPERIVARAGVSLSTLFRHFGNADGVARAMRERLVGRVLPIFSAPFAGDGRARLADLVRRRREIFEIIGPLRRAADRGLGRLREYEEADERRLADQVRDALGPELEARDEGVGELLVALLSFETWSRLRTLQGLDPGRAARLLEWGAARLLDLPEPSPGSPPDSATP